MHLTDHSNSYQGIAKYNGNLLMYIHPDTTEALLCMLHNTVKKGTKQHYHKDREICDVQLIQTGICTPGSWHQKAINQIIGKDVT